MNYLKKYPNLLLFLFILLIVNTANARKRRVRRSLVKAKSWIIASLDGKKVYLSKKPNQVRAIASLSKLIATNVIIKRGLNLKSDTKMLQYDWNIAKGGCRTRLRKNKFYVNYDLLHAALLGSDNRSIPALGRSVGMNAENLVKAMNDYVKSLNLRHTRFKDPTGINHENVSTARELVKILRFAYKNKVLRQISQKVSYVVYEEKTHRKIIYNNTNILTRSSKYRILLGKTGYNDKAGYCLATVINDKQLGKVAFVILGSTGMLQRFADFRRLYSKFQILKRKLKRKKYFSKTRKYRRKYNHRSVVVLKKNRKNKKIANR